MNSKIAAILTGNYPFCLIQKQDGEEILMLLGEAGQYEFLNEIPRKFGPAGETRRYDTISMIPFCQVKERGFSVHDDGEKIRTILVTEQLTVRTEVLLDLLPGGPVRLSGELAYDNTEAEYQEIIRQIVTDEIGEGEGANFVIRRNGRGRIADFSVASACSLFASLVRQDYGTYWKFLFYDTTRCFVGSTPERHLLVERGRVRMNPISGTFRKDAAYECRQHFKDELLAFLSDQKEINELFMVVDEELKMMARMCRAGGAVVGPLLKEMSQLIHSEYLLAGLGDGDIIDLFRQSMFAATVVGSPVENACRIIKKYSKSSRRYYGSGLLLLGRDPDGADYLDSPITIRTLEIESDGLCHFGVGATLVKDSVPSEEVRETLAKSRAILRPLRGTAVGALLPPRLPGLANDDDITLTLSRRNQSLSDFWFFQQEPARANSACAGMCLLLIDNGDDFIYMLRHIFTALGLATRVVCQRDYDFAADRADITLLGPGPGNPNNERDEKIRRNMSIAQALLESGRKSLFICLGHQILCRCLGYSVHRKDRPLQGSQLEIDLFGTREKVGFYNTFAAKSPEAAKDGHELALLPENGEIAGIRGRSFIGYQFHPESILTRNGFAILRQTIDYLLADAR